ncbi:MAG: hypothetical protein ACTJH9_13340 [Pseudoalteromonas sp.]
MKYIDVIMNRKQKLVNKWLLTVTTAAMFSSAQVAANEHPNLT